LLWPRFVRAFAAMVRPRRLHLETAGAHPATLASLLGVVDHVSLDLKLPGDLAAPVDPLPADEEREGVPGDGAAWRAARRSCLDVLAGRDACAKLVLCDTSSEREAYEALDDLADLAPELPLFVQPATPFGRASAPSDVLVRSVWVYARELGLDPRVVPQVHRLLGVR
ncbi:MAG: hypothetical protein R3F34_16755, partial [Planctomycetota bacterium]